MASSMLIKVTYLVVICLVLGISLTNANLSCGEMHHKTSPCVGFIQNIDSSVPAPCCEGIKTMYDNAKTPADHQDVCRCLKPTLQNIPRLNLDALANLAGNCGVDLHYKFTPDIDCDKYISDH
ncbi:hypothetical protein TSUD_160660 [Trifolium subterraneum]|uniref:Non-specific lipid-transfer protein n=1 Tax=Trifolium subterraneum TaxID=3900 RepID=A0A2Z6NHK6_TRISU|nr:hypothetical protein TSUD_160660 [Trifolium subterraneum]